MRRGALRAVGVAVLVVLAGCGGERPLYVIETTGNWVIISLSEPRTSPGDTVLVASVDVDADDGCLYMNNGGLQIPTVWPAGTSFLGADSGLQLANGDVLSDGAPVTAIGQFMDVEDLTSDCPGADSATPMVADIVDLNE